MVVGRDLVENAWANDLSGRIDDSSQGSILRVRVRVSMKISLLLILNVFHALDFRSRRNSGAQELILDFRRQISEG